MPPIFRAALWMTGAIVAFSCMAVAGREASLELDTFEIMLFRSAIGLVIMTGIIMATGKGANIAKTQLGLHFIRNIAHFSGQNLWFFAITLIPLAQVFALEFTSPIWVILLSPLILGERITPVRVAAALVGFVGILIVARPQVDGVSIGVLAAASSAVGFAVTNMLTRRLTRKESVMSILFHLTWMQLALAVVCAGIDFDIALPSVAAMPWLLMIAIAGLFAHMCLGNALSLAPAAAVQPMDFLRLPVIALIGVAVYGEVIDIWVLIGAAVIFAGNYLNIWTEARKS